MNICILRENFTKILMCLQNVVQKRPNNPALAYALIKVFDHTVEMTATDQDVELKMTSSIEESEFMQEGTSSVPVIALYETIRRLPEKSLIHIFDDSKEENSEGNNALYIQSSSFNLSLPTIDFQHFPPMFEIESGTTFQLDKISFLNSLKQTSLVISTDESRPYLNGVYIHGGDSKNILHVVTSDGHRLAKTTCQIQNSDQKDNTDNMKNSVDGFLLPRKTIFLLEKLLEGDDAQQIFITVASGKIKLCGQNFVAISKLIDGTFPSYQRVIPQENSFTMLVDTKTMQNVLARVMVMASDRARAVKISFAENKIKLLCENHELGSAQDEIAIECVPNIIQHATNQGNVVQNADQHAQNTDSIIKNDTQSATQSSAPKDIAKNTTSIALNARYLHDIVHIIPTAQVEIGFNGEKGPVILKAYQNQQQHAFYVLMPMWG